MSMYQERPRLRTSVSYTSSPHHHRASNYDRLSVFQASPLAYRDSLNEELCPLELLDFDREREVLSDAVRDAATVSAKIDVVYETATTDRLGAALATGDTSALHFSCHGHPDYLCFEDGSGGAQFLTVDDLRDLLRASGGGDELRFVFVSACYSRAAGEAFVAAGVEHVVCCQQDEPIMDSATIAFASNFYRALACGKTLRKSFELGRQAVKLSPSVSDAANEMQKFLLLPEGSHSEGSDHDVPIFFTKPSRASPTDVPSRRDDSSHPSWLLPHPPRVLIGREMDMYRLLQLLKKSNLIRLTGIDGIGKKSLAAAICHYINSRSRSFHIEEVIWLPLIQTSRVNQLRQSFQRLWSDVFRDESKKSDIRLDPDYMSVCGAIIEALYERRCLLVIDASEFKTTTAAEKLSIFLDDVFRGIKDARVILVCRPLVMPPTCSHCIESELALEVLGFQATATLFGSLCPLVNEMRDSRIGTPRQIANLLVPKGQEELTISSQSLSRRNEDIFELIGDGIPAKIHGAAREMKAPQYNQLIQLGERAEYRAECKTRVDLEHQLACVEEKMNNAAGAGDFGLAKELQGHVSELEALRGTLHDEAELRKRAAALAELLQSAISLKDYGRAEHIQEQLKVVEDRIIQEGRASKRDPVFSLHEVKKGKTLTPVKAEEVFRHTSNAERTTEKAKDQFHDVRKEETLASMKLTAFFRHVSNAKRAHEAEPEGRITYFKVDDGGSGDNILRYAAIDEGRNRITFRRYMELLSQATPHARGMAADLSSLIRDCPYRGLFFETMGVSTQTVDRVPFEFVLVDSPHLARFAESAPNEGAYAAHFDCAPEGARCCAFDNLQGDARLIAPRIKSPKDAKVYSHLAAFVRGAEPDHLAEVWKTTAKEFLTVLKKRNGNNVFLSTCGTGVAWLHFRLDSIPKYYSYGEFARGASARLSDVHDDDNSALLFSMLGVPVEMKQEIIRHAFTNQEVAIEMHHRDGNPALVRASRAMLSIGSEVAALGNTGVIGSIVTDLQRCYHVCRFAIFTHLQATGEPFTVGYYSMACVFSLVVELQLGCVQKLVPPNMWSNSQAGGIRGVVETFKHIRLDTLDQSGWYVAPRIAPLKPEGGEDLKRWGDVTLGAIIDKRLKACERCLKAALTEDSVWSGGKGGMEYARTDRDLMAWREITGNT